MERESTKHGPRVDDQLAHEVASVVQGEPVEAHTRDDLQQEGPIEHPGERPDALGTPAEMDADDVQLRSALAALLRPAAFPADRDRLLAVARGEEAPDEILDLLDQLPSGPTWDGLAAVWEALGGATEHRDVTGHPHERGPQ